MNLFYSVIHWVKLNPWYIVAGIAMTAYFTAVFYMLFHYIRDKMFR